MATNANQFNPDDPTQQQGQQQGQGNNNVSQPVNISGSDAQGAATGAQGSSPSRASTTSPRPTSSGSFQNLNAYLRANQGFNQQNGGLAGQLNQNLTSQANDLQKNYAQAQQDYQTSVNNARQRYDSNLANTTLQNASSYYNPSQGTQYNGYTYGYGPNGQTSNSGTLGWYDSSGNLAQGNQANTLNTGYQQQYQPQIQQFQNMLNATYRGPTQLDANGELQAQTQDYTNLANNVGTEQGRYDLLRQIYNKPTYTAGQQTLDNLFLQANPTQLANLQNAKVTSNQLNNQFGQDQAQAAAEALDATNEAKNTALQTQAALNNSIENYDPNQTGSYIQQAIKNAQYSVDPTNPNSQYAQIQSALQGGTAGLTSQQALALGLIPTLGSTQSIPLYNLLGGNQQGTQNLLNWLTPSTAQATAQNVANAGDYNTVQALSKLANGGSFLSPQETQTLDTYGNPSSASTFSSLPQYNFDNASFQNAWNAANDAYQKQSGQYNGQINAYNADLNGGGTGVGAQFQGGLLGQVARDANDIKTQLLNNYNQQQTLSKDLGPAYQLPSNLLTPDQINGMTNVGLLQYENNIAEQPMQNGQGGTVGGSNPYGWLLNAVQSDQQGLTNTQQLLKQLNDSSGYNQKINISDAAQYAPVQVAPNPSTGLPGAGDVYTSGQVPTAASNVSPATLAALGNIYNRI